MARPEKLYRDKDWLHEMYWVQGKGTADIAKIARCSTRTIVYQMKRLGIPRRTRAEDACRRSKDSGWQRRNTETLRRLVKDPGWYGKLIEGIRRRSQDPEWVGRTAEANRRKAKDPEWRRKQAEGSRRRSQDPEWRERTAKANRQKAQNPEWRERSAEANRQKASDPEWLQKVAEAQRLLALKKRNQGEMTDIEAICYAAFESLGLEFIFEKFIKRYRVDFFFPSHGIIVEAMGAYWHSLLKQQKHDAERKQFLEVCGYTVLEWWGPDIKANVWKLIDEELLPLLNQPSRIERPPRGVSKPYRGEHGRRAAVQLYLFSEEQPDQDD